MLILLIAKFRAMLFTHKRTILFGLANILANLFLIIIGNMWK